MRQNLESNYNQNLGQPFFQAPASDLYCLEYCNFTHYIQAFLPFAEIMNKLHQDKLFAERRLSKQPVTGFSFSFPLTPERIGLTSYQLLTQPCSQAPHPFDELTAEALDTSAFPELTPVFACYIALLCDVLKNKLAKKFYEERCNQENVTEQEHALEAGKIAYQLGMSLSDILALLLHDIARPTAETEHGHKKHGEEGSIILSPLGLDTDYSGHHGFAKKLLFLGCDPYRELISDTSWRTLKIQSEGMAAEIRDLAGLDDNQLAATCFKLMFMRLIDDMSKAPVPALKTRLGGANPEFFDEKLIQAMLKKQINDHLTRQLKTGADPQITAMELTEKLQQAMSLLLRAKDYSNDDTLYKGEEHCAILAPLLVKRTMTP